MKEEEEFEGHPSFTLFAGRAIPVFCGFRDGCEEWITLIPIESRVWVEPVDDPASLVMSVTASTRTKRSTPGDGTNRSPQTCSVDDYFLLYQGGLRTAFFIWPHNAQ